MATLILTAVGTVVGGPIGAAVGAIVGQQIDQAVFKPTARQGPRLSDLALQTSTYGSRLPKLFGSVRVAGTVIWATDLIETRTREGGGKGRAATDVYRYSASFAVALSGRPIVAIGRIWADGKLLRGAAGDLKVGGAFRLLTGAPDQLPDPLLVATEVSGTPAYRGTAYAVFEGLQLAEYGNRIPSLSFEVIADPAAVGLGTVIAQLSAGQITAAAGPPLIGVAATGDSVRGVAEAFALAMPMTVHNVNGTAIGFAPRPVAPPATNDFGSAIGDRRGARLIRETAPLDRTPAALTIGYFDPARDYQPGVQRARREGPGYREARADLPAALAAADVRRIAETMLARVVVERRSATVTLPWRAIDLRPGDGFTLDGTDWRVRQLTIENMIVSAELVATAGPLTTGGAVAAGRSTTERDLLHGRTEMTVVDLPPLSDVVIAGPQVAVFANGASAGWRRAAVLASIDGGTTFDLVGSTALPATIGTAVTALPNGTSALYDRISTVEIELLNDAMTLYDADADSLVAGANRAMIGNELLQFGRAQALGARRWRLSGLWRGRRGTEQSAGGHVAGERFVLIDPATAFILPPDKAVPGVVVMASGIGDADPWPTVRCVSVGRAVRPLAPVNAVATRLPNGDTELRWVRRSREGWAWRDGVDAPLGEEREAYRITRRVGAIEVIDEVVTPTWTYLAATRTADSSAVASVLVTITQLGSGGQSDTAMLTVSTV